MIETTHSLLLIFTMAAGTILLRFLPFVLFAKGTPKPVLYLGNVLPHAIIAMLVIYCLKNISFVHVSSFLPEVISGCIVVGLHKCKHNTLLSILVGTIVYMLLVQFVFVS